MAKKTNKGIIMEEILRIYFLKIGYFVVRGIPFKFKNFEITDIDLWLFNRTSSVSREISIVDIKNKRTPQAIERIFWVKGLQIAVKASNAIVATTDKRIDVKEFGQMMDVFVLDGNFLNKIKQLEENLKLRITNEDFFKMLDNFSLNKLDGNWKNKLLESKSLLAIGLNFDNVNRLIENARFFVDKIITIQSQNELALRCFYTICSYIAIIIDYLQRDLSFLSDVSTRKNAFFEGFKYGTNGEKNIKQTIDMSLSLIEQYSDNGKATANQARLNIIKQFEDIPTNILAEYFSKQDVLKSIFKTAIEFESIAMQKVFVNHLESSVEIKSFINVLLDFYSIDRVKFAESIKL